MRHPYSLIAVLLLAGPSAIADTPSDNAETAPVAAQAPAETAVSAAPAGNAAAAPAQAPAAAPAPASNTTTIKMAEAQVDPEFIPPPGFKTVKNGVNVVYCTTVKPIGSNLPQKYCLTKEQVMQLQQKQDDARREMQKSNTCSGGGCGGS